MVPSRRRRSLLAALCAGAALAAAAAGPATASPAATSPAATPGSSAVAGPHAATTSRAAAPRATAPSYLLALGDSLASGYQPIYGTDAPPTDPVTGYTDTGYPGSYAADLAAERHLHLVDLACPGETTKTMTGSPAIGECTKLYKGELHAPSQLAAAKAFLAEHKGDVALVTLDIGANDIDGCVSSSSFSLGCVQAGVASVTAQLPAIVAALKQAIGADDPAATFVAMNYYDPFLGIAYKPGGASGAAGAALSVAATDAFNSRLGAIYRKAGVPVANVASAFRTGSTLPVMTYDGHRLPLDVDYVCRWTWMCPPPGSKSGPNIHADTVGYRVLARAFEKVLAAT